MKKIVLIIVILGIFLTPNVKAQEVIPEEIDYNVMENLIEMAKDYYPQRKIVNENEKQSKNNVTVAHLSYLDIVNVSYYWRPEDRQAINQDNPYVTNGFQFGLSLSPSSLLSKPFQVRTAKSNYKIAQLQQKAYEVDLANEVKTRYYSYVLQMKDFKQKSLEAQSAKGAFLLLSDSFQRGEITVEEYNSSRASISNSDYSKLQSRIEYLRAKDNLEEIIGREIQDISI